MTASLQYSCLEKFHGQRSLAGYSPWGCRESDMTGQLSTHTRLFIWLCWVLTAVRRIFIVMWDLALWRTDCLVVACGLRVAAYRLSCSAACGNLSSLTRDRTHLPCTTGGILNHWTPGESWTCISNAFSGAAGLGIITFRTTGSDVSPGDCSLKPAVKFKKNPFSSPYHGLF